jgi:cathepsin L
MRASFAIVVCLLGLSLAAASFTEDQYQLLFSKFVAQYNKKYSADQFFYRYTVFKQNLDYIYNFNKAGNATFKLAMNAFGDETHEEFTSTRNGYLNIKNDYIRSQNTDKHIKKVPVAASVDWRTKGAVTPVKNQQQCGSCWAFSTTGSVEGAHAIKTGKLVSLSEQQLVDCSTAQGNQGCNGGLMDQAFQYIIANGGICSESAYPYTAQDGSCESSSCTSVATISGFKDVTSMDETALMAAVNIGPVSIAIEADQACFQFYSGGVLSDPSCGTQLDHGVLVVGYGTDAGTNYWIVKNSWGESWGENGYIRLVRGSDECGIAMQPSYPIA